MEHHKLKFVAKDDISEKERNKLLDVVKAVDPSANLTDYEEGDTEPVKKLTISLTRCLHEKEVERINNDLASELDDYFIETVCEVGEEETEEPEILSSDMFRDNFGTMFQEMSHEMEIRNHNRLTEKRAQMGWHYGEVFDPAKKESPLMKPYNDLPEEYRIQNGKVLEDALDILKNNGFKITYPKSTKK